MHMLSLVVRCDARAASPETGDELISQRVAWGDSAQRLTSQRACREARPQRLVSMQSHEAGSVPCRLMLLSALQRAGGGACVLSVCT